MLIFYGLGNNEAKYLETKHNLGRVVVENMVDKLGGKFELGEKIYFYKHVFEAEKTNPVVKFNTTNLQVLGQSTVYFVYSSGYMNNSGQALASFVKYYKINTTDKDFRLIILHDDSDQLENNFKFLPGGGSAGNNGIIDIYKHLPGLGIEINQIWRLKIGIRPENNKLKSETFVLSRVSQTELEFARELAVKILSKVDFLITGNFDKFQSHLKT